MVKVGNYTFGEHSGTNRRVQYCTPETNVTLCVSYTSVKRKRRNEKILTFLRLLKIAKLRVKVLHKDLLLRMEMYNSTTKEH